MEYLKVTKVDDVIIYRRGQKHLGTLHLTTHHIIFTIKNEEDKDRKPIELWFCYPMIERVDFNRGSALLYEIDSNLVDNNGNLIIDYNNTNNNNSSIISTSSLATTASEFTNTLSNGFGFGNIINSNSSNNNNNNNNNINEDMNELSIKDEGDGIKDFNEIGIEKRQYDIESKQRELCRGASIRIQFRDFNYISFDFKNILKGNDVFESMFKLTCIENIEKLYAFIYQPIRIETKFNSWNDYNVKKEFERQGLIFDDEGKEGEEEINIGSKKWRISKINSKYEICSTYPKELIIPKSISDTILKHTVKFRSKNRFPTLTYYYKKNGCCIIRCSQPLVGIKQNRSIQDEKLIYEIFKTNKLEDKKNLIIDARPITNAMAQVALGAGSEIMENYGENNKKIFLNIENIHVMRDSLNKIKILLKNNDVNNNNKIKINKELLNKSGWLEYISKILKSTELLVKYIKFEKVNLLIHCSDGWDRTTQICSLVEICIEPYYRTIEGFIILIEKEWISFGHRFNERCGILQNDFKFFNNTEDSKFQKIKNLNQRFKFQQNIKLESPIFQQFLDCLYQILIQNPKKFEFNERFLRRLIYHLYSCQYGTFLVNNEKEKFEYKLNERTRSVWDYFKSRKSEFLNKEYEKPGDDGDDGDDDVINIDYGSVSSSSSSKAIPLTEQSPSAGPAESGERERVDRPAIVVCCVLCALGAGETGSGEVTGRGGVLIVDAAAAAAAADAADAAYNCNNPQFASALLHTASFSSAGHPN
ncbi:hypothetical protein C6P42_001205 [Pichia californica]|nr:hypothetical protein C6P42_001205 [[Candida] californica]